MLIEFWLDQPVWLILAILAAVFGTSGLLFSFLTVSRWTRARVGSLSGVVAPFFGSVAILFGLLAGFAASDAWERNRQASRSILAERDGLVAIHDLSVVAGSEMPRIRAAVRRYAEAVVTQEWPGLRDGRASGQAAETLRDLLRDLGDPSITRKAGTVAHASLLEQSLKVRSARSDRLSLSEQHSDHPKWWTVLLLGCLTQMALALVHIDKPRAQAAALFVFSTAAVIALGLVGIKERPFDGPLAFQPTALQEALAAMKAAPEAAAGGLEAAPERLSLRR